MEEIQHIYARGISLARAKIKYRAISHTFKILRESRRLSQQFCADFTLCTQGFWNHIENGNISIEEWRARVISKFLNVHVYDIFVAELATRSVYEKDFLKQWRIVNANK